MSTSHFMIVWNMVSWTPSGLLADEGGLEEHLGAAEALVADGDHLAVGQLVRLLERRRLRRRLHLLVEVEGDVGELLLDVAHDLALGRRRERVAALGEDLHHVVREVASRQGRCA